MAIAPPPYEDAAEDIEEKIEEREKRRRKKRESEEVDVSPASTENVVAQVQQGQQRQAVSA